MNKAQVLILITLIALAVYYFNQETKPALPFASQKSNPLPSSLPKYPASLSFPSPHASPAIELTDYSWLTDDNLEFILKNHPRIQAVLAQQKQFHLRTDIANLYNAFHKAKTNQAWDLADFCQELAQNRAQYILFPLRVNGNHWGLMILAERVKESVKKPMRYEPNTIYLPSAESIELVREIYYTSSGGVDLEDEKKQIKPLVEQVCGVGTEIKVIYPADRNSKGYECGVYVVFYVLEILERGKLELKRTYSAADCQQFRREWKQKIGPQKWCKWN
jgi:hypothetical protein